MTRRLIATIRISCAAIATLALLAGCGSDDSSATPGDRPTRGDDAPLVLDEFQVSPHPEGVDSPSDPSTHLPDDPAAMWAVWRTVTPQPPMPAAPQGTRLAFVWGGTGLHRITWESGALVGTTYQLTGTRHAPGPRCGGPAVVWGPAFVVAVPETTTAVELELHTVTTDC